MGPRQRLFGSQRRRLARAMTPWPWAALLALAGLMPTSLHADVPPRRSAVVVRVQRAGACDVKAIVAAVRAAKGRIERCADGEPGTLSAVLTLAPGQTTQVSRLTGSHEPGVQRCIARRVLQTLHLPGQPACAPLVHVTLQR